MSENEKRTSIRLSPNDKRIINGIRARGGATTEIGAIRHAIRSVRYLLDLSAGCPVALRNEEHQLQLELSLSSGAYPQPEQIVAFQMRRAGAISQSLDIRLTLEDVETFEVLTSGGFASNRSEAVRRSLVVTEWLHEYELSGWKLGVLDASRTFSPLADSVLNSREIPLEARTSSPHGSLTQLRIRKPVHGTFGSSLIVPDFNIRIPVSLESELAAGFLTEPQFRIEPRGRRVLTSIVVVSLASIEGVMRHDDVGHCFSVEATDRRDEAVVWVQRQLSPAECEALRTGGPFTLGPARGGAINAA